MTPMKILDVFISQAAGVAISASVWAQGTFQNLNFEQANPVVVSPFIVTSASAIPDWTAEIGGAQQADIKENFFSTGDPEVVLIAPGGPTLALQGSYSVMLTGSFEPASITQTGVIPAGSQSLFFDAQAAPENGSLAVQVGTQTVSFIAVATEPNYTVYGANISAWAGQTEPLTFTALQITTAINNWTIDDISFSPGAIPEPNPLVLTGIAGLLFALYRRIASPRR
jgi:hypothetical protein